MTGNACVTLIHSLNQKRFVVALVLRDCLIPFDRFRDHLCQRFSSHVQSVALFLVGWFESRFHVLLRLRELPIGWKDILAPHPTPPPSSPPLEQCTSYISTLSVKRGRKQNMKSHRPRWVLKVGRNTGTRATALVVTVAASMLSAALLQAVGVAGMIHNLNIHKDARPMFQIESFGFRERGFMNLTVSHFSVSLLYRSLRVFKHPCSRDCHASPCPEYRPPGDSFQGFF